MRIKRDGDQAEPEINLIPLIDILLVIVIFLVVNTTFVTQSQLKVELPGSQSAEKQDEQVDPIRIVVGKDGNYSFGGAEILDVAGLKKALTLNIAARDSIENLGAVIEADAMASHQSVVSVMDILASLGVARVSIAASVK